MDEILKTDFLGGLSVKLNPAYAMEKSVLERGVWEPHVAYLISELVQEGDTCVDVGANAGLHTLAMAIKAGRSGCVHAFEPSSTMFARLRENVSLNPKIQTICCHKLGLGEKRGVLKLFQSGDGSNAYLAEEYKDRWWNTHGPEVFEECNVISLDEFPDNHRVQFLKIDVEGMEFEVFRGAQAVIKRCFPTIVFETLLQDFDKEKIKRTEEFLNAIGYRLFGLAPATSKLIPLTYPKLFNDSVAIHVSKLGKYSYMMDPFEIYQATLELGNASSESIEFIVTGNDERHMFLKFSQNSRAAVLFSHVHIDPTDLSLETTRKDAGWKCSLKFSDRSFSQFSGSMTIGQNSWTIHGSRTIRSVV